MHPYHKLQLILLLGSVFQNAFGAKIINGKEVSRDKMKYMASLQSNGMHKCGGFLISADFVLTAAHCEVVNSVVLGTHHLSSASSDMRYDVKKCKHPSYETVSKGNDVMLLKLSRKATVQPVDLPSRHGELTGSTCTVAGWGYISNNKRWAVNDLHQVSVSVISKSECQKKWHGFLPDNTICAGGMDTHKGFCQADSGGPLVCNDIAVGIVSFNFNGDCNYEKSNTKNDYPNVYTDIYEFLPWINSVVASGDC